jgi:chromosome segregation ATPase
MVEDDDDSGADDDDADAFSLESAAARRQTNKSAKSMSMAQEKVTTDLQNQVSELQAKVGSLENTLQDKDNEIQRLQEADTTRNGNAASERAEWDELRVSLEERVEKAEGLNTSLRSELDRLRSENEEVEQNLRSQVADLESRPPQQASDNGGGEWRQRCEELERELSEQQEVAEEVRRDASTFLQEMKELSARSDAAAEKEERMVGQISTLETELKDWKSRYAKAKTQLRNLKASSMGLSSFASHDVTKYTRDPGFASPDGVVKDVHVTKFQLSIDELLQTARRANSEQTLESMRHVVKCVRAITGDLVAASAAIFWPIQKGSKRSSSLVLALQPTTSSQLPKTTRRLVASRQSVCWMLPLVTCRPRLSN